MTMYNNKDYKKSHCFSYIADDTWWKNDLTVKSHELFYYNVTILLDDIDKSIERNGYKLEMLWDISEEMKGKLRLL